MAMAERVASGSAAATIDVAEFIDRQPISRFQIGVLLLCALVLFLDGFDTQAVGYVAPALSQDWKLARGALGPAFSVGLTGLMIGALVLGPIADRVGRKRIIIFSAVAFGVGTLATAFVPDITWLLIVRFLTGLGLGGAMPNAVALTSEYSPQRRRATMVMVMFIGFSVGAALGGLLASALIPSYGWRSVFVVGGIAPLVLAPLLAMRMPESIRFLTMHGNNVPDVAGLLTRVAPSASFDQRTRFAIHEPTLDGLPVAHLFGEGRGLATILFWIVFFMSLLDIFLLANWLPTVLNDAGASVSAAAAIGAMFQIGGVVGAFALGRFIDRYSFRAMALTYLLAAVAVALIGLTSSTTIALVTVAIFFGGFFVIGGQDAANALSATYYPTMIRSTGVGWSLGIGRIGSIVGPLIGGMMLARQVSGETLFLAAAIPALIAGIASFALARAARS
jgi:AAHS family 4-hydroxybenzoate transporter-like MFS transporter